MAALTTQLMLCKLLSALYILVLTTQLNHLASLAKWFSARLQTGSGFESHCCHLCLLIQKLLIYIKKEFLITPTRHACLVSNCGLFEAGILSALKNFIMFSGKPFEWVPCFPAGIFISPTSDTPTFKSFSLQLFFRETLNSQSVQKKTVTSTFPIISEAFSLRCSVADSVLF